MRDFDESDITAEVLKRNSGASNDRLRSVMEGLVRHLHAFARETQLTEEEWLVGIQFLTRVGQMCSATRQEFILLSDTLGLSMLVDAINNRQPRGCTQSTVLGPFHVDDAKAYPNGADIANGAKGEPCLVRGTIRSSRGTPIGGAVVDVWQADADGYYDVQYSAAERRARGVFRSNADGRFWFWSILASKYPIPHDGPVGEMLAALNRHPWRPAHLHFLIEAQGFRKLVTHVFRAGDPYLESDAVVAVKTSLIADWKRHEPGTAPDGSRRQTPFYTLDFDFVLAESEA
jgi:hydroxyquinol 1,2-dioxygenase